MGHFFIAKASLAEPGTQFEIEREIEHINEPDSVERATK